MSDESEQNKHEELTDIAKELRELSESAKYRESQPTVYGKPISIYFAEVADRIEAIDSADAWRSLYTPGNAAAIYAALVKIHDLTNALDEKCGVDPVEIRDIARAALSAPPRNCDVGTPKEQGERCLAQFDQWRRKGDGKKLITAIMNWAQTPYEQEGAGI